MWWNTFFKKDIHKLTWITDINGSRSLLDFIIVQECDRNSLLDVNVYWEAGGGISDYHLVEEKIRSFRRLYEADTRENIGEKVGGVKDKYSRLKEAVLEATWNSVE